MERGRNLNRNRRYHKCTQDYRSVTCRTVSVGEYRDGWKSRVIIVVIILLLIRVIVMQSENSGMRALN